MISLIFDTETTGFPFKNIPPDHHAQARVMQIAMVLMDGDNEIGNFYAKLLPDEWPAVNAGASAVHGLTAELCEKHGVSQHTALQVFESFVNAADVAVAFNLAFDSQMLDIEIALNNMSQMYDWNKPPFYCAMKPLTPIMGITRANGQPKWPKLSEAYAYCCNGATIDKAHDALGDVRATAKVWKYLLDKGIVTI